MAEIAYLGDGVYLSHDGFQFWLAANHHDNKVIALEPAVWDRLKQVVETFMKKEADTAEVEKHIKEVELLNEPKEIKEPTKFTGIGLPENNK